MFVHLHTHSYYSFCRGANSIEELCQAAKERGMNHLALTDTNGVYGLIWFLQIAKEMDIKPIIGTEITSDNLRAILLVKDRQGYTNLCHIISHRHLNGSFSLLNAIARYSSGLIVLCNSIPLLNLLKQRIPPGSLFVDVQPGPRRVQLLEYAHTAGIPPVATNSVYFVDADDSDCIGVFI